jgi:hypothetical protein
MIKINLTTFPRSGRTFFLNCIMLSDKSKNISINAYHFKDWNYYAQNIQIITLVTNIETKEKSKILFDKKENHIGIIRNPIDCILSVYAMTNFFNLKNTFENYVKNNINKEDTFKKIKKQIELNFEKNINDITQYYIKYYNFYLTNFNNILLLKFEDVVNNTKLCLEKINNVFFTNLDVNENYNIALKNTDDFLVSSKENDWYLYAQKNINNNQLMADANKIYNELINKLNDL